MLCLGVHGVAVHHRGTGITEARAALHVAGGDQCCVVEDSTCCFPGEPGLPLGSVQQPALPGCMGHGLALCRPLS